MNNQSFGRTGRMLAGVALTAAILLGALFALPRILSANPPEPSPSQDPSRPPSASPTPTPSPTPSPTDEADGLVAGPIRITDAEDGFRLDLPEGWYTNAPGSGDDAYRWWGPTAFDPDTADGWTVPISISMQVGGSFGPGGRVVSQETVTVGGYSTLRMEVQGEAGGMIPANALVTLYLVAIDGDPVRDLYPGRWLLASVSGTAGDYEANQEVLDQLLASLEVLD